MKFPSVGFGRLVRPLGIDFRTEPPIYRSGGCWWESRSGLAPRPSPGKESRAEKPHTGTSASQPVWTHPDVAGRRQEGLP